MKEQNETDKIAGRREIHPWLWLKGLQGLMSQSFGFRTSRSNRGIHQVGYFEGIHTEKQRKQLARRRAKNKMRRATQQAQRRAAK